MPKFDERYLQALAGPLPEDIAARKAFGDLAGCGRLIDLRLSGKLPEALRRRLIVEKEVLQRLPLEYPDTREDALAKIRAALPDFSEEEFDALRDRGRIDWIYLDGRERYFDRAVDVLLDDPDLYRRSCFLLGQTASPEEDPPLSEDTQAKRGSIRLILVTGHDIWHFETTHSLQILAENFVPGTYRVWLPIPGENGFTRNLQLLSCSGGGTAARPDAPQRTVFFERHLEAPETFSVTYAYDAVIVYRDLWTKTAEEQAWLHRNETGDAREEDTSELLPHIRFDAAMRALAAEIAGQEQNPLIRARLVYDFITKNVKYSYVRDYASIEDLSGYAGIGLKGDCGIQALLFITLCRSLGIPARWQSGHGVKLHTAGSHDWACIYVAPFGWRYVDLSAGGDAFAWGDEERRRFYFGNMDCFLMAANRDFQANFEPPCTAFRSDPYDNQDGEVEVNGEYCLVSGLGFEVTKTVRAEHRA